jgi:hypothetical protein
VHYSADAALEAQIARLDSVGAREIKKLWSEHMRPVHPGLSTDLLRRQLAHTLQEARYGKLNSVAKKRLDRLYDAFCKNPEYRPHRRLRLTVGTILTRNWRGKIYKVAVIEQGYQFDGCRYGSLSSIAVRITGTKQSGWKFFGLSNAA